MKGLKSVSQVAVGAAIGVLAGGTIVWAHGGDTSQVHGCVQPGGGQPNTPNIRVVGAGESCPSGWTPVDWSIAGPVGPPGPAGAPGAPGPAGPPPPRSDIRAEIVSTGIPRRTIRVVESSTDTNTASYKELTVWCPASHALVISGGYTTTPATTPRGFRSVLAAVVINTRTTSGRRQGWRVAVIRAVPWGIPDRRPIQAWRLTTRAECADTS